MWREDLFKSCKGCNQSLCLTDKYWITSRSLLCRSCKKLAIKNAQKKYKIKNKDLISKNLKQWRSENTDAVIKNKRKWASENKEKVKKMREKHFLDPNNKEKKKSQDKDYYLKNKDKIRNYQKQWENSNILYLLRKKISHQIRLQLKKNLSSKNGNSIFKYINYSLQDLNLHIESLFEPWMNWNNWGIYRVDTWDDNDSSTWTWNIDHIIPQSQLPYDSMDHPNFKKCWSLNNLRPLSAKQNILDGNRR